MEVSPQAERFSEIHPLEETEEMRKKFQELLEAEKIVTAEETPPLKFSIVSISGPKQDLKNLQNDLRKAGYRKLR